MSLQLLLQFSVDSNRPIIVPMTSRGSYYTEVMLDCFLQKFVIFLLLYQLKFLSTQLFVHFLSFFHETFQLLLSSDLSWRDYTNGFVCQSVCVSRHNLVSSTSPTVSNGFWWNFEVIVPMTWRCSHYRGHAWLISVEPTSRGLYQKSIPVLSTESVLRKAAVDRGLQFSTEQYGCRQRDNMILTPFSEA